MAKTMKATVPAKRPAMELVIVVDPTRVARGHRTMRRGGVHGKRMLGRAASKRRMREEDVLLV